MKKKAIILIAVLILLLIYPVWRINNAKIRINQFYQQLFVDTSIENSESLAQKLNLIIIKSEEKDSKPMTLVVWDGWAFARWTCFVSYEKNKVVGKKVLFLDIGCQMAPFFKIYIICWTAACFVTFFPFIMEREPISLARAEYWRFIFKPWRLMTFAIANLSMTVIAPHTGDPTWDYFDVFSCRL
ncbi:MAG: hypothetical protein EHM85_09235 [Desulfobacteraceae bacterium]|nr:MAG: hypothetical protein EHM85_09235 [Desulfobacteraceae bacterium]